MCAQMKRFLLVTASIGSGHNRAAQAIADALKDRYPSADVHIVDFMSAKTGSLNGLLKGAYLKMLSLVPDMYDFLYNVTAGKKIQGMSVQSLLALAMKSDMRSLIDEYKADVVICTHPFPCAAAAYLKKNGWANITLIGAITDFTVHQLWVYPEVDLYFVGNAGVGAELARRGIAAAAIHDTGIPIGATFNRQCDKRRILASLGFTDQRPVVLIMGGGLGLGGVKEAINNLETMVSPLQIIVVTGENPNLWSDIKQHAARSRHNIQVTGFANNVQDFMAIATLLISKPGALTISEALAMELPMVLHEPIPGQEKENAAYIEQTGAAIWVKDSGDIAKVVGQLLSEPDRIQYMHERAKYHKRPNAAYDIAECIGRHINVPANSIAEYQIAKFC